MQGIPEIEENRVPHEEESTDNGDEAKPLDFDSILPQVGEYGKYQKLLIWCICLPACIPCGFHAFNQLFMMGTPDHWCLVPDLMNLNITKEERRRLVSPPMIAQSTGQEVYDKCMMYDIDYSNYTNVFSNRSDEGIIKCQNGYEFEDSEVYSSVVIDFELVCDYSLYPTLALSALNIGGIIGVFIFGLISDRYGRMKSFFICLTVLIIGGVLTATAPNFWFWTGYRFIVGLTIPAIYQIPFIIGLELVGPRYRSFITVLTCLFYTLGLVLLCGVAYLIRNWVVLSYVTSVPFIGYYIYMIYLPESPRWLVSQGRIEEAAKILKNMASINGKQLSDDFNAQIKRKMMLHRAASELSSQKKQFGVGDLCKTPNNRLKTLLLTFNWLANETVYVGLSYYSPAMGSNEYLSFFLSCVVEVPGYFLCWAVMDRWGRRWPLCLLLGLGGTACIATVLMPEGAVQSTLALYLVAKFAISASFLILYPFAGELYPTEVRGLGIGFSSYIGGIGLVIIPFINYLGQEMLTLPLVIMGALSVVGGILGLRLPETLNQKLPQTLEEGEEFGKNFTFADCCSLPPPLEEEIEGIQLTTLGKPDLTQHLPDEMTPLQTERPARTRSSFKNILVRQMSVMEVPFDPNSGAVKLHYWY